MEQTGTVEKALDVLYHLHRAAGAQGVSEIGRALRLPKSTAHRLLAALGRRGLVERDPGGRYRPGTALVALGLGVLGNEPVVAMARPVLEAQAAALGETLFLAAARGGRIVVLDKEEGRGFLRAAPRVGDEIPVHATAIGKLHLAFAPEQVAWPEGRLPLFTPRTRRRERLEREVARARRQGWAENRDEWVAGLSGIAAPVLVGGRLWAALAVSGPSQHFRGPRRERFIAAITRAARRVAERLEGRAA